MKFTVGPSTLKSSRENRDKNTLLLFFFFTKMLRPGEQRETAAPAKTKIQGTANCTYNGESAPLSIHVFTTHTITTQGLRTLLALLLEADKLVQYIKQINTYIHIQYIHRKRRLKTNVSQP